MKPENSPSIVPTVHLEFIQNQAGLAEEIGAQEVETYHRALFLHHHARELEQYQQQARIHESRLASLEAQLTATQMRLAGVERLMPNGAEGPADPQQSSPWNFWDRTMFVLAGLGVACLLVFGVLNVSFNLLESGLVTFQENPVRAYFWAALLPVGALAIKVGWDFLESKRKRDVYLWSCLILGIAGVLVWVASYAAVYPTLSKSSTERIDSLSVFDTTPAHSGTLMGVNSAGAKWIDVITVAAQAVAEIFLSAVLGMYMTMIHCRHRLARLAENPLFLQLDEERSALEQGVARERLALGEARGNQGRLEHQLAALLAFARSMFQKEAALRRDQSQQKRLLLDQISDQIRTQLENVENGNRLPRNNHGVGAVAEGSNGK